MNDEPSGQNCAEVGSVDFFLEMDVGGGLNYAKAYRNNRFLEIERPQR